MGFYLVPAVIIWGLFYYSGVHSTLSGVAMAMLIPMEPRYGKEYFVRKMASLKGAFESIATSGDDFPDEEQRACLRRVRQLSSRSVGMSYRLEEALAPYVTFLIMPIFALANAGVGIASPEYFRIFTHSPEIGRSAWGSSSDWSWASRWHIPCGVDLREDGAGLHARRGFVADAAGGGPAWAASASRCRSSSIRSHSPMWRLSTAARSPS
mgnify:CR=1 FL=1